MSAPREVVVEHELNKEIMTDLIEKKKKLSARQLKREALSAALSEAELKARKPLKALMEHNAALLASSAIAYLYREHGRNDGL